MKGKPLKTDNKKPNNRLKTGNNKQSNAIESESEPDSGNQYYFK